MRTFFPTVRWIAAAGAALASGACDGGPDEGEAPEQADVRDHAPQETSGAREPTGDDGGAAVRRPDSGVAAAHTPGSTAADLQVGPETTVRFADALLRDARAAPESPAVTDAARDREIEYTKHWLRRLLPERTRDALELGGGRFRCVSGVGPRGDDAVLYTGVSGDARVEVVDSRVLVLSVSSTGAPSGIRSAFRLFVDYGSTGAPGETSFRIEESGAPARAKLGLIHVNGGQTNGWFAGPFAWASSPGPAHVIVVDKWVEPPPSKAAYPIEQAPYFTDGIAVSDPRTYLRFSPSNREELARERFSRPRPPQAGGPASGELKGLPIVRPKVR